MRPRQSERLNSRPAREIKQVKYLHFASGEGMRLKLEAMLAGAARSLLFFVVSGILAISVSAQVIPGKIAVLKRVEPGLENAVKWEWHVAPSDEKDWGLQSPDPTPTPTPPPPATVLP